MKEHEIMKEIEIFLKYPNAEYRGFLYPDYNFDNNAKFASSINEVLILVTLSNKWGSFNMPIFIKYHDMYKGTSDVRMYADMNKHLIKDEYLYSIVPLIDWPIKMGFYESRDLNQFYKKMIEKIVDLWYEAYDKSMTELTQLYWGKPDSVVVKPTSLDDLSIQSVQINYHRKEKRPRSKVWIDDSGEIIRGYFNWTFYSSVNTMEFKKLHDTDPNFRKRFGCDILFVHKE